MSMTEADRQVWAAAFAISRSTGADPESCAIAAHNAVLAYHKAIVHFASVRRQAGTAGDTCLQMADVKTT